MTWLKTAVVRWEFCSLPGKFGQRSEAAAIFTRFRGPGGNKFAKGWLLFLWPTSSTLIINEYII
jgi:hypothetical protein